MSQSLIEHSNFEMTSLKTPFVILVESLAPLKKMAQFFPLFSDYKEFREPFLGGGSVALYITQMYPHLDIWVNDLYEPALYVLEATPVEWQ